MRRILLLLLVAAFLLLRLDFWWADEAELVAGLPISLLYHSLYCLGAAFLVYLLGKFAWQGPEEDSP